MPIRFEYSVDVARSPEEAFALVDDLAQTPKWLVRCTGIETLTSGPNRVGTRLRYSYKDGGRTGVMDGEITVRVPGERLVCRYTDRMMHVTVDFRVAKAASGARLRYVIEIEPQTLAGKLLTPLIRRGLPGQTTDAMKSLKQILDGAGA